MIFYGLCTMLLWATQAALLGSVNLITSAVAQKPTVVKSWSALRKIIKGHVYRAARLKPRISDVDFQGDEAPTEEVLQELPLDRSAEEIAAEIAAVEPVASRLLQVLEAHPPASSIASSLGAARRLH